MPKECPTYCRALEDLVQEIDLTPKKRFKNCDGIWLNWRLRMKKKKIHSKIYQHHIIRESYPSNN